MTNRFTAFPAIVLLAASSFGLTFASSLQAQQPDARTVIQGIDAAVNARNKGVEGYIVTEHYAVFREKDEVHPTAEMTVQTLYRKNTGKSYSIVSQSGSELMRKLVLAEILAQEKTLNQPGTREGSWITSANYEMLPQPEYNRTIDGRNCLAVALKPKRLAPYLIDGTIWVDAKTFRIVRLEGIGSKSPSLVTKPTNMARQYTDVSGFAMATHARAVSESTMFGQTVVKIDYSDYRIQLAATN